MKHDYVTHDIYTKDSIITEKYVGFHKYHSMEIFSGSYKESHDYSLLKWPAVKRVFSPINFRAFHHSIDLSENFSVRIIIDPTIENMNA